jgi:hypothetical protein
VKHVSAGFPETKAVALVGSSANPPRRNDVAFSNDVIDLNGHVGERIPVCGMK